MFLNSPIYFYLSKRKIIKKTITLKLKGGALFVAILISIIIGVILSLFILIAHYNQRESIVFSKFSQLHYNLKSGFQIAQSRYFNNNLNGTWFKNIHNDDSIHVEKKIWGAFLLIAIKTKNRHEQLAQSGLFGTFIPADTALLMPNNDRPIGVSGAIVFKANCYLPAAGLKPTYLEGQNYIINSENSGYIKKSPNNLPPIQIELLESLKETQQNFDKKKDSLVDIINSEVNNSFSKKTIVCMNGSNTLSRLKLKNNIKLIGNNMVLDSSCHFNNILIVARKVHFKEGFKGKVHVIASDSIICEPNCQFNYPSSFVLLPEISEDKEIRYIQFSSGCQFYGGILAINPENNSQEKKVMIRLHANCEINGLVYSDDYLHLQGKINASVFTEKLLLKTPSAVYENHMMTCELNPKKYSASLAVPIFFNKEAKLFCCQKVN